MNKEFMFLLIKWKNFINKYVKDKLTNQKKIKNVILFLWILKKWCNYLYIKKEDNNLLKILILWYVIIKVDE